MPLVTRGELWPNRTAAIFVLTPDASSAWACACLSACRVVSIPARFARALKRAEMR
jgi:hypothetical protein